MTRETGEMRHQNGVSRINQKKLIFKQILRTTLILLILIPLLLEVYFVTPNIVEFTSGKEWVRALINSDFQGMPISMGDYLSGDSGNGNLNNGKNKSEHLNSDVKLSASSTNNNIILLLFNPSDYLIGEEVYGKNTKGPLSINNRIYSKSSNLRNNLKSLISYSNFENIKKSNKTVARGLVNLNASDDTNNKVLIIKKDECDCKPLSDNYIDKSLSSGNTNNRDWYILSSDGENFISKPAYIQMFALMILVIRWIFVVNYTILQLLIPIIGMENLINKDTLKSNIISLVYFSSSSLSLSITGIEGKDCITWWFFGPDPEYVLKSQLFVWFVALICILLYLVKNILEKVIHISVKYKLLNDFIKTFIYIPMGLIVIISVTLCILGIIKPWIFLVWATSLIIELEKNIRELSNLNINGAEILGITNNYDGNSAIDQRNLQNGSYDIDEVSIVEIKEGTQSSKSAYDKLMERENDLVIIPISNSYFKILDSSIESCCKKLCQWYMNHSNFRLPNNYFNSELIEFNNKFLNTFEFKIIDMLNHYKYEFSNNKLQSFDSTIASTNFNSLSFSSSSSSSFLRTNSFQNSEFGSSNSQQLFICNICFLEYKSIIIFTPCGHGNVCIDCLGEYLSSSIKLRQYPKCHICREEITKMIEIEKNNCFQSGESKEGDIYSFRGSGNNNSQLKIITGAKLVAEVVLNSENSQNSSYNNFINSNSSTIHDSPEGSSNKITLKISTKNSNLLSQPCIKELIELNNQTQRFNFLSRFLNRSR
ncbi:hypothetical protein FG379_000051 [Cryptosporidium bovis]|uniref:uncharacterized protein n=1 Tax=Cryptosporidium bovis TaxID=310047 RepID=UPI00351A2E6D|nr:hypothetical protein FG379_000051 [Cryptosporidium bovis]